jgi:tetratricopeptide (TPR) repeat protein
MASYDPNVIIQAAEEKLTKNDFEGGQMIFQAALLEWVDDAREGGNTLLDADSMRETVATLWLAYAHFLALAKQFKSAMEAYEQAVECPVAGVVGRVWLDYARFAEERGKLKTAQDIYLRALVGRSGASDGALYATGAVTDEQDQNVLWHEFLDMMQKTSPELTLSELQSAVQKERAASVAMMTDPETVTSLPYGESSSPETSPPTKRIKVEEGHARIEMTKTHVVTAESVDEEAKAFAEGLSLIPPDLAAAWMARDGNSPAHPPEPPLFGPSPPKLSDPVRPLVSGCSR